MVSDIILNIIHANLYLFAAPKSGEGVPDECEVVAIMKRRDTSVDDGDLTLKQKTCIRYSMEQFLIVKEDGDASGTK